MTTPMTDQTIRPSRLWYAVAAGLLVGVVICIVISVLAFISVAGRFDQLQRVEAPGRGEVVFSEPGRYTLYVEGQGVATGFVPAGIPEVTIEPLDGGPPVTINEHRLSSTYTINGHEARAVGTFHIDRPGTYQLRAGTPDPPDITGVAVGKDIGSAIVIGVIVLLGGIFLLAPSALVVAIITYVRRRSARRALRVAAWPAPLVPGPYPWPAPPPWPPYPPAGPGYPPAGSGYPPAGSGYPPAGSGPAPVTPTPPADQPDQPPRYDDRPPET